MDCSMPGLPVPHHLPEFAQVHIHESIYTPIQNKIKNEIFAYSHYTEKKVKMSTN